MSQEDPNREWVVFTEMQEQTEILRRDLLKNFAENGTSLALESEELTTLWEAYCTLEQINKRPGAE